VTTVRVPSLQPLVIFPSMEKSPLLCFFRKTKFCRKHPVLPEKVRDCRAGTHTADTEFVIACGSGK